jgi:hypothetical protein
MIPRYEGPTHPLSSPIEALTAVSTADYNHRAVGIRSCESAFHLASTILGGRDIIEEFVAARIWSISYGWAVVWTSLGPLHRWVPGPTTRWAPGTTRLALHGT